MDSREDVVSGNPTGQAEAVFQANLGLVGAALSRGFSALSPAQRDEAEAWGRLGLWYACQRFDPARGYQFSTFAHACIRGYILRGLKRERTQTRLPCLPLDAPVLGSEGGAGLDLIADDPKAQPGAALLAEAGFEALLSRLPPRQQELLRELYQQERTLQSVAGEWGVTRAATGIQHVKALRRLRQMPER